MTRSATKVLKILSPGKKFEDLIKEHQREIITHRFRRRRPSNPPPTTVLPQPRKRRVRTLGAEILWCYCEQPDDGNIMVRCDVRTCHIKWFHVACLQENVDLTGPWSCRFCRERV